MKPRSTIQQGMFGFLITLIFLTGSAPQDVLGTTYLYTNAPSGSTVFLAEDIVFNHSLSNPSVVIAGIGFSGGDYTGGSLDGSGSLTIRNISTENERGAKYVHGISGYYVTNLQSRAITVVNDQRAYKSAGKSDVNAFATGHESVGWVAGDMNHSINVSAHAGSISTTNHGVFDAYARAEGISVTLKGNLTGTITVDATSGNVTAGHSARVSASASGVSYVYGNVEGEIHSTSTGGTASIIGVDGSAGASSYSYGVGTTTEGNVSGVVSTFSQGGSATAIGENSSASAVASSRSFRRVNGEISGTVSASSLGGSATGEGNNIAYAKSIGAGYASDGLVGGDLVTYAQGGHASSSVGNAEAYANADGFAYGLGGNLSGLIQVAATGGIASTISGNLADASADACGIDTYSSVSTHFGGDVSGHIEVDAIGGMASGASNNLAEALAVGIRAKTITIGNFSGTIEVTASAGVEGSNLSKAMAIGITASDNLQLNATSGSIRAHAHAPIGFSPVDLPADSMAVAIQGGNRADTVALSNMEIVGDIDLRGGSNTVSILGDTTINGDILAGNGTLELGIMNGTLAFGNSPTDTTVDGNMTISADGTIELELGGHETGEEYDHLTVTGLSTLDGQLDILLLGSFSPTIGTSFNLFDWDGGVSNSFATVNAPVLGGELHWDTSELYTTGHISVIPEPGSVGLLGIGSAMLLFTRRHRRKKTSEPHRVHRAKLCACDLFEPPSRFSP